MAEKDMRAKVIKLLKPIGAFAVENSCLPGTPDVNCDYGWIELKYKRAWPRKADTVVRLKRFTINQKRFLMKRYERNGDAYLFLQINGFEWFLFRGDSVHFIDVTHTRNDLHTIAHAYWNSTKKMEEELQLCLATTYKRNRYSMKD